MNKRTLQTLFALSLTATAAACGIAPPAPSEPASAPAATIAAASGARPAIGAPAPALAALPGGGSSDAAEYRHTVGASRFRLGANVRELSEMGWYKVAGDEGVFATDPHTGATRANPSAGAPSVSESALTTNPQQHNARVLNYFATAGLPRDQVTGAHVTTIMKLTTAATETPTEKKPEFVAYTSILERSVGGSDGIRVADSFAWARFNARDEVMAEGVYWPRIPAQVIDEARALRARLSEPGAEAAFRAPLGVPGDARGSVVIRHTNAAARGPLVAFASYDVNVPVGGGVNGRTRTFHFDVSGAPREIANADPDAPPTLDTPR